MHIDHIGSEDTRSYCAATRADGWVFPAGQVGERPDGTIPRAFAEEVEVALDNLSNVLHAAGSDLAHVVRMQVILADIEDLATMNAVYLTRFPAPRPSRFTIAATLAPGYRVEFVATALVHS